MSESQMAEYTLRRYDEIRSLPRIRQYYGNSDFLNLGYWEETTADQRQACENLMERLLSLIPDKNGTVLDVACGKGATTAYLLKYFHPHHVTAIDLSAKNIAFAKTNAPGCTLLPMNATAMAFPDCSFKNVICVEAAFHFHTRENFLIEAFRVLQRGGVLVLSDILMTLEGETIVESRTEKNYVSDLEDYHLIFKRAGFSDVTVIDATEQCWKRHFWHLVRYTHEKLLSRQIRREELSRYLYHTYRRALYVEYYPLVAARKI
jgi:ubiquinone/menaquinone biosynthesis C-methylase UbiE